MANEGKKAAKAAFVTALRITLNPGATQAAKGLISQLVAHHRNNKNEAFWTYYCQYGPGETYVIASPGASLKAVGTAEPALKGLSSSAADALVTQAEALFAQHDRVLLEYLPDFSNHPQADGDAPGPFLFHTRFVLKSGVTRAAAQAAGALAQAHAKAKNGRQFWTFGTFAGGNERAYHVITPFNNFGDLDGNADGIEDDGTLTGLDSNIESIERNILEYLPDFSNPRG